MKALLSVVVCAIMIVPAFSQKQFEGTIHYTFHSPEPGDEDLHLTVVLGKNAIKLKFEEKNASSRDQSYQSTTLIRVDSGSIYHLISRDKTYTVRKLKEEDITAAVTVTREILGYTTRAVNATSNSAIGLLGGLMRAEQTVFYEADSLFYTVPGKYASNAELAFLHEGKIVLRAEIKIADLFPDNADAAARQKQEEMSKFIIEASSVKWEAIADAELSIPADFVKVDYSQSVDSATTYIDTLVVVDTVMKNPQKKPAKTPAGSSKKPNTPSKKTTTQQSGTIKKPE